MWGRWELISKVFITVQENTEVQENKALVRNPQYTNATRNSYNKLL